MPAPMRTSCVTALLTVPVALRPGLRIEPQEPPDGMHGVAVARVVRPEVDVPLDAVEPVGPPVQEPHEPPGVERHVGDEGDAVVAGVQMPGVIVPVLLVLPVCRPARRGRAWRSSKES